MVSANAAQGLAMNPANRYSVRSNVIALGESMSAACSPSFKDANKPPTSSPSHQSNGTAVNVKGQVSSCCAGYGSSARSHKRQGSKGGDGGSSPKKHRSNNQGDNTYNNAPPGSGPGGHDNNDGGSNQNNAAQNSKVSTGKRYACPFHKLAPALHQACKSLYLTSWDRVLQHIVRSHVLKEYYCAKCRTQFTGTKEPKDTKGKKRPKRSNGTEGITAEKERIEHIRSGCQLVSMMEAGYIFSRIDDPLLFPHETDYDNLKRLRGSDEEKWFKAWDKLFPELQRPESPLFESDMDILRRNALRALAMIQEPLRSWLYNAIFELPTVASRLASRRLAPPHSALTSDPAMTPPALTLSPGQIGAPALAPAPPSAPTSGRPQVPPGMHANLVGGPGINVDPSTMHHTSLQVDGHGQPPSGWGMDAPGEPHPLAQAHVSPSVGYSPALPDESPAGQQNSLDQFSNLDTQTLSGQTHDMLVDPISGWTFANAGSGWDEDDDELLNGILFGDSSGFDFNYPAPGSAHTGSRH